MIKKSLRILSVAVLLLGAGLWAAHGFHTGWTKTQTEVTKVDEITGLEYKEYEDHLTLGIEVPVVSVAASVGFFGLSLLIRNKR